jgi:hypothetical protein
MALFRIEDNAIHKGACMAKSISELNVEDFEPHRGESFRLNANGATLELTLSDIQRLGTALREGGAFSLIFTAPAAGPLAPQAIYPIAHAELGTLELFVVPIQPKDGSQRYEVIFT